MKVNKVKEFTMGEIVASYATHDDVIVSKVSHSIHPLPSTIDPEPIHTATFL